MEQIQIEMVQNDITIEFPGGIRVDILNIQRVPVTRR